MSDLYEVFNDGVLVSVGMGIANCEDRSWASLLFSTMRSM